MECIFNCDLTDGETDELKILKGNPSISCDENGMIIDTMIFEDSQDRDRVVIEHNKRFHTRKDSEILIEAILSSKQYYPTIYSSTGVVPNVLIPRIRNIREDPRMCSTTFCVKETNNGLRCMFVLTDDVIYAYYGRDLEEGKGQASFGYLIPLCRRGIPDALTREGPLGDFYCLAIGFHQRNGWTVRFYIDGKIYYSIDRVGYRLDPKYCVYERGGTAYQIEVEELELSFRHSSPLDFYLPDNYAREYITTDKSGRHTIYRNGSALIQIKKDDDYAEPFPDFMGDFKPIKPEITFAVNSHESRCNPQYRTFGQGVVTRIQNIEIIYRFMDNRIEIIREETSSSECSERDHHGKHEKYSPKRKIVKGAKTPNERKRVVIEDESDSFIFHCPNEIAQNIINNEKPRPLIKKTVPTGNIDNGPRKKEMERHKSPLAPKRGGDGIRRFDNKPPEMTPDSKDIVSFERNLDRRPPSDISSESKTALFKHEHHVPPHSQNERPKTIVEGKRNIERKFIDSDSLISLEDGSLETVGKTLKVKSHEYCWYCDTQCIGSCCSGKCGSRSCSFIVRRGQKYKGNTTDIANTIENDNFDKPPVGRPIKLTLSSKRYQEININD